MDVGLDLDISIVLRHYAKFVRNIDLDRLQFFYGGVEVSKNSSISLGELGLDNGDTIDVIIKEHEQIRTSDISSLTIKLVTPGRGVEHVVKIGRNTILRRIFVAYVEMCNTPVDFFTFRYNGNAIPMCPGTQGTPVSIGMKERETITCELTTCEVSRDKQFKRLTHCLTTLGLTDALSFKGCVSLDEELEVIKKAYYKSVRMYRPNEHTSAEQFQLSKYLAWGQVVELNRKNLLTSSLYEHVLTSKEPTISTKVDPRTKRSHVPNETVMLLFNDGLNNEGYYFPQESKMVDVVLTYVTCNHHISTERLQFITRGKIIPKDYNVTIGDLRLSDHDDIHVSFRVKKQEVLLVFNKEKDGSKGVFVVSRKATINEVFKSYSEFKENAQGYHQFAFRDLPLASDSEDTIESLGKVRNYDIIMVRTFEDILVNVKNEYGKFLHFRIKKSTPISTFMLEVSERTNIPVEQLRLTFDGWELPSDSNDTMKVLALKQGNTIYMAHKTEGIKLTDKSIELIYVNGSSATENPSFKPHLQIVDVAKSKHCKHDYWKVVFICVSQLFGVDISLTSIFSCFAKKFLLSDGINTLHGECDDLFDELSVGNIIRVDSFLIVDCDVSKRRSCKLTMVERIAVQEEVIGQPSDIQFDTSHIRQGSNVCHYCKEINNEGLNKSCNKCWLVNYCSQQCQLKAWKESHKQDCQVCSKYFAFAKNDNLTIVNIVDFWLSQERRQVKPLCRDNAARICNSLLYHSFLNRQVMGNTKMLKAHVLNSAFLRQSCTSSVKGIADAVNSGDDFNDMPYLTAGINAIVSSSGIYKYLELNHADDVNILDSSIVEGQVMVMFGLEDGSSSKVFHIELTSDLSEQILRPVYEELGIDGVRFTYDEKLLNPTKKIFPYELGMKSRGGYIISVTSLTEKEVNAQVVC